VLEVFREPGSEIVAEDLGIVPDYVRASLARLSVPGYKVLRWERHWDTEGRPFKDPVDYPACAVATSGTHDTEPMVTWWEAEPEEEKDAVRAIPSVQARAGGDNDHVCDALIESLVASGADLVILPIQDVFGWRDRINQPATVSDSNWTWRLPWAVDRMMIEQEAVDTAARLKEWTERYRRGP
jgi:4-alpha-glucanotransferase